MKERDEEIKKRKEAEAVKKGQEKQLNQVSKGNQQHEEGKPKTHSNRQTNARGSTEEYTTHKEEQWHIQTRKKNKNQQQNPDQVVGGRMAVKEKTTNMQEGEPKGRGLPHVLHKNQTTDLRSDLQAPATTASAVQQHQK
ncbi:hypothetical protein KY290_029730 [Solanum tuberosum]|uniref:Uncharacterized protein n=1 Tax=Solanum tuberosum TaxID=4113 RepID=A0ABQ7ULJ1_SOLTU|nr:hypothetical protein KY284_028877 [Solanum tuberosum]KAH0667660.1 hypothetical protein KY285_028866 [Solanum tuberosum]KAH0750498.1 hypothetical protein KY290_029730 [Solanum tuberosum]